MILKEINIYKIMAGIYIEYHGMMLNIMNKKQLINLLNY